MADEKTHTIRIGGDAKGIDAALTSTKRLLRDVHQQVEKLNTVLGQTSKLMVGIVPGGKAPGGSAAGQTPAFSARALTDSKNFFAGIAAASKSSLQTMTSALRSESAAQQQHLDRLRTKVQGLTSSYAQLEQLHRGGQISSAQLARGRTALIQGTQELGSAADYAGKVRSAGYRAGAASGDIASRYQLVKEGVADLANRLPAAAGISPMAMSLGAGAVIGAAAGKIIVNAMKSGMQEAAVAPTDYLNREISRAQYGNAALGISQGNRSLVYAMGMASGDQRYRQDFSLMGRGGQRTISGFEQAPGGGYMFNASGRRVASAVGSAAWRGFWLDPMGGINQGRRDIANIPFQTAAESLQMAQRYQEMRPEEMARFNQFQSGAVGNISLMQNLAVGAGYYDPRTKRGMSGSRNAEEILFARELGLQYRDSPQRLLTQARRAGITPEQLSTGHSAVEGVGGLEAAQRYRFQAAIGARGHLYGTGQILGAAAQTGDAGAFFQNLNNLVGRGSGGVDVGAANLYGQTVAGSLGNGAAPTSGLGLLGAMGAYGAGSSGAQEMLRARFAGAGNEAIGSVVGGRVDAYQQGSNLLAAIRAAPNASVSAQEYLSRIDPRVLFDVVGSGKVPPELAARGISASAVKAYSESVMSRTYDRSLRGSPNQGGQMNAIQKQTAAVRGQFGGSFQRYVAALPSAQREQAFVERGAYLSEVGLAPNDLTGQAFARQEAGLGRYGTLTGGTRGRGVTNYAAGSTEDVQERANAEFEAMNTRKREAEDPAFRDAIAQAPKTYSTLSGVGSGQIDISKANQVLDLLLTALRSQQRPLQDVPLMESLKKRLGAAR